MVTKSSFLDHNFDSFRMYFEFNNLEKVIESKLVGFRILFWDYLYLNLQLLVGIDDVSRDGVVTIQAMHDKNDVQELN